MQDSEVHPAPLTGESNLVLQPRKGWAGTLDSEPSRVRNMKYSLRKTPSHLHLAYKYGEASDSLTGRHFMLEVDGRTLTLTIDLTPNFHTRSKGASAYLDVLSLAQNHHKLRFLQCSDNLVRTRLIRAWEQVQQPQLRMCLDLGSHGRFVYAVHPRSLFTGGIQFDVEEALQAPPRADHAMAEEMHSSEDPA